MSGVGFSVEALQKIIREYTREAGVRNLERKIGAVCRKIGTRIAENQGGTFEISPKLVEEFLDHPTFLGPEELSQRTSLPGVVPGLAWTSFGGDILFIEATRMPGSRGFQITGSVGNVMQESARAALSYVRSRADGLGLAPGFFEKNDIHMHIPAGATPKDGPSAGVAMATALVSLISGRKVRPEVGMTGEITLRGRVLPIGGVKQKVLAAQRAGLRTVILPKRNEFDLEDIPEEIRQSMKFVLAETVDDVLAAALEAGKAAGPAGSNGRVPAGRKSAVAKKRTPSKKAKTNVKSNAGRR